MVANCCGSLREAGRHRWRPTEFDADRYPQGGPEGGGMSEMNEPLYITYERTGNNGTVLLTAKQGETVLGCEKLDMLRPRQRRDFVDRLCAERPDIDPAAVEAELVELAAELTAKPTPTPDTGGSAEVDISRIVRPELFHTETVSGIAIPVAGIVAGEPVGRWELYLRWHADGKRERRALARSVDLPDASRLWIHPMPAEPSPRLRPGWSAAARRSWLAGSPAPEPADVFKRLCERIAWHVDFEGESAAGVTATLALWSMFTYAYPAWPAAPYLSIGGPLASGKSTLFAVLSRLVFRPLQSSSMTAPCLFRSLDGHGGTLLLDEAERLRDATPDAGELRAILLSGYKAGSPARRLEKVGDAFQQIDFDVFGPKAFASISNPPEALASRCIRLTMFRAGPASLKPRRRIDGDSEVWQGLRDTLHGLALEHGPTWLRLSRRSDVVPEGLAGREYEIWQPLLALAGWLEDAGAGGLLALMQRHAEATASEGRDDATPDADLTLLRIVAQHVVAGTHGSLKAGDVLKAAQEQDRATFDRWSPRGVGSALGRYGLKTARGHGNTGRTFARVTMAALARIAASYGIDLDLPQLDVSHVSHVSPDPPHEVRIGVGCDTCDTCDTFPGG
jgi:hypothetical protein